MKVESEFGVDMSISLEIPRIAGSHPKLGNRHGTVSPSGSSEGTSAASTLILGS